MRTKYEMTEHAQQDAQWLIHVKANITVRALKSKLFSRLETGRTFIVNIFKFWVTNIVIFAPALQKHSMKTYRILRYKFMSLQYDPWENNLDAYRIGEVP
jgi:hypothetical protein